MEINPTRPTRSLSSSSPDFQIFMYILHKYFNLRFAPAEFDDWLQSDYAQEVKSGSVFYVTEYTRFIPYNPPVLSRNIHSRYRCF
ncbi:hypothetical protein DL98DRAFT_511842 [Cadophora sp. DSE1049]|nr:hypothetical protein DL98DRAFT_511842 [Cadophora sp. DSE1049]